MEILQNDRILFTGDSITDANRNRNDFYSLAGYCKLIDSYFQTFYPELNITVINRGISGDTSKLLSERIEKDIIETDPTIVTILIGINDVWRKYDANIATSIEEFSDNYYKLLSSVKKYTSKIIILEPFLIPSDANKNIFREDLDPKINKIRELAHYFKTEYLPLDGIFAKLSIENDPKIYSDDGVHPRHEGQNIIAMEWLKQTILK